MKNYIQPGKVLAYANAGSAIKSGDVVPLAGGIGIAAVDIAATSGVGSVELEGVFSIAKATGAISQGAKVYWDNSAKKITTTAMSNTICGFCFVAALSGDASVQVKLQYMGA